MGEGGVEVGFGDRVVVQAGPGVRVFEDALVGGAVAFGEDGAQGFVALDEVGDRGAQGGDVEAAAQAQGDGDVVGGAPLHLVEEPEPELRERQRNILRAPRRHQNRT
ncbi:hypothetical protein RKD29_006611 [Streptomyces tendae]